MSKRTLYIPDEAWDRAVARATERGMCETRRPYSVSEYIRLLVESDNGEVRADDAGTGVGRPGRGQSNAAPRLGDGAHGKDAAGEPAQTAEVGGGTPETSLAFNAESDSEQSAREGESAATEGVGTVPGSSVEKDRTERATGRAAVSESEPAAAQEVVSRFTPAGAGDLASRPFTGPITKESQTRKHRGKR